MCIIWNQQNQVIMNMSNKNNKTTKFRAHKIKWLHSKISIEDHATVVKVKDTLKTGEKIVSITRNNSDKFTYQYTLYKGVSKNKSYFKSNIFRMLV